jgi:hypothetical protein
MDGACGGCGELENAVGSLVRITEENTPLGKPRFRRQNNIKMKLRELVCVVMNLINLVEDMDSWRACVSAAAVSIGITKTAESVYCSSATTGWLPQ